MNDREQSPRCIKLQALNGQSRLERKLDIAAVGSSRRRRDEFFGHLTPYITDRNCYWILRLSRMALPTSSAGTDTADG